MCKNISASIPSSVSDLGSVCEQQCPKRWCCSVSVLSSPPPVCDHEIRRIRSAGHMDFYETDADGHHLRVKSDGYCCFFDAEKKQCSIYDIRPFDCRLFPVDFIPGQTEGQWIIYDCPYSRALQPEEIENILLRHENEYRSEILETWDYDGEVEQRSGIRVIRAVRVDPSEIAAAREARRP